MPVPQAKAEAHYVTPNRGGYGAARDAVEFILDAKGILDQCIETLSGRRYSDCGIDGYGQERRCRQ